MGVIGGLPPPRPPLPEGRPTPQLSHTVISGADPQIGEVSGQKIPARAKPGLYLSSPRHAMLAAFLPRSPIPRYLVSNQRHDVYRGSQINRWQGEMKKKLAVGALIVVAVLAAVYVTEWRYSDDMQQHINTVNSGLQSTQVQATASGLVASLQSMTAVADVGGEIIGTHDHVHTLKDAYLAWKIKRAIQQSTNVGAAIRNAIESWQENVSER